MYTNAKTVRQQWFRERMFHLCVSSNLNVVSVEGQWVCFSSDIDSALHIMSTNQPWPTHLKRCPLSLARTWKHFSHLKHFIYLWASRLMVKLVTIWVSLTALYTDWNTELVLLQRKFRMMAFKVIHFEGEMLSTKAYGGVTFPFRPTAQICHEPSGAGQLM